MFTGVEMSERFTASNGATIDPCSSDEECFMLQTPKRGAVRLGEQYVTALREFFQSESDKARGVWRSVEHPEWVVYDRTAGAGEELIVFNDFTAERVRYLGQRLGDSLKGLEGISDIVACEYLAALKLKRELPTELGTMISGRGRVALKITFADAPGKGWNISGFAGLQGEEDVLHHLGDNWTELTLKAAE